MSTSENIVKPKCHAKNHQIKPTSINLHPVSEIAQSVVVMEENSLVEDKNMSNNDSSSSGNISCDESSPLLA